MPRYAFVFMVFMMASVGLPGTSGFIGEFLVMVGAFKTSTWLAVGIATGMFLGAAYMLYLYRRVIYGALTKPELKALRDLTPRELVIFAPVVVLVFWMGLYPTPFLDILDASVSNLIRDYEAALAEAGRLDETATAVAGR
jgi:NADH-quinone oxidoreductase subunit M